MTDTTPPPDEPIEDQEEPQEKEPEFVYDRKAIPTNPGCYLYYDKNDKLIYVGKAKHLRKRVSSYFTNTKKSVKTNVMVGKIRRIETQLVQSESEALILENNLIKEHKPRFNILLRDDKTFVYMKITNETFPRVMLTRRIVRDGSFYAGPKTSSKAFRRTMKFLQKVFKIRTCKLVMTLNADQSVTINKNPETRKIPCLDFHLKKCSGPCSGDITHADYMADITAMKKFLRGDTREVIKQLKQKMITFATEKKFEAAAKMRDLLQSIEISTERQVAEFTDQVDRDFIGLFRSDNKAFVVRLSYRFGKRIDQTEVALRAPETTSDADIIEQFITQFYPQVDALPKEIYIPTAIENTPALEGYLESQFPDDGRVYIHHAQRGDKKAVTDTANTNAKHFGKKKLVEDMSEAETFTKALPELTTALNLPEPPERIEGYDISHLQGTHTVASQVVFTNGKPDKGQYRRYKLKTIKKGQIDDFASMNEILQRRFANQDDEKFASKFPDLIVIDGGKGQLSSVMKAVKSFGNFPDGFDPQTQIISLAKREEQIYRPDDPTPIELPLESAALRLLQRIRDESHRFAISFNRSLRVKAQTKSLLDEVDGIGPSTKKKLIATFGSVSGVRKASDEELSKVLNTKQLTNLRHVL